LELPYFIELPVGDDSSDKYMGHELILVGFIWEEDEHFRKLIKSRVNYIFRDFEFGFSSVFDLWFWI